MSNTYYLNNINLLLNIVQFIIQRAGEKEKVRKKQKGRILFPVEKAHHTTQQSYFICYLLIIQYKIKLYYNNEWQQRNYFCISSQG